MLKVWAGRHRPTLSACLLDASRGRSSIRTDTGERHHGRERLHLAGSGAFRHRRYGGLPVNESRTGPSRRSRTGTSPCGSRTPSWPISRGVCASQAVRRQRRDVRTRTSVDDLGQLQARSAHARARHAPGAAAGRSASPRNGGSFAKGCHPSARADGGAPRAFAVLRRRGFFESEAFNKAYRSSDSCTSSWSAR